MKFRLFLIAVYFVGLSLGIFMLFCGLAIERLGREQEEFAIGASFTMGPLLVIACLFGLFSRIKQIVIHLDKKRTGFYEGNQKKYDEWLRSCRREELDYTRGDYQFDAFTVLEDRFLVTYMMDKGRLEVGWDNFESITTKCMVGMRVDNNFMRLHKDA